MGLSINQQFSDNPFGVDFLNLTVGATGTVTQMSNIPVKMFRVKAAGGNSGTIFLCSQADGQPYFPLGAGDDTGWIPLDNPKRLYWYGSTVNDTAHVFIIK